MSLLQKIKNDVPNKDYLKDEAFAVKEITFYMYNSANEFKDLIGSIVKYLKQLPWKVLDGVTQEEPLELARRIFANPIVSDFLIHSSRLPVFSKELAKLFKSDLDTLAIIKQLKFFYNQPTVAVLQQLAMLVVRSPHGNDAKAIHKWDTVVQMFAGCRLGGIPVCRLLEEINGPACYEENAECLQETDPHAVYPTSIYRICDGYILAKPDASMIEGIFSLTLTTTIKIVNGVLNPANPELKNVYQPLGRCVSVIDDKVEKIYGDAIQNYFDQHKIELNKLVSSGNEVDKDISTVENILVSLRKLGVARNEPVLVVGGGVIADVAGFATALYHRETPYVMLCTSIVAGIDAGPSPRTCCDGFGDKNVYGAYHPPILTITDRSFFRTLHYGWLRHGIAEIVKMAVVKDEELFSLLEQASCDIISTKFGTEMEDFGGDREAFEALCDYVIGRALEWYVRSEYGNLWETHQCRPHAYGHTWSIGYEIPSGMLHGHAVSTGMGLGAYLSFCKGWITEEEMGRILKLLSDLELSLWHPIMGDAQRLFDAQERAVKKRGGNLVAPVPKGIGNCAYINHLSLELLVKRLQEYHSICQEYPREGLGVEAHCRDVGLEDPSTGRTINEELPEDCGNSLHGDDKRAKLDGPSQVSQVRGSVQEDLTNGYHPCERADDTPSPPPFENDQLCHEGVVDYALKMTQVPSEDIQRIALVTKEEQMFTPCMVGQQEAQFLKMMAQLSNANRVLDVGTFTGMSAMAFAEGLPASGEVVTLEFDPKVALVAHRLFRGSTQAHKLTLKVGDAVNVMRELKTEGEKFDIVFLDATKEQYISYYKLALEILTPSGFIMADNSLCALLYDEGDSRRQALHDFNQMVKNDVRVEQVVLPLREGVSIIRPMRLQ